MYRNIKQIIAPPLIALFWVLMPQIAISQVVADFTSNITEGCTPLIVQFTSQSTGSNLTYSWTLGDPNAGCNTGPVSNYEDPGRIFTASGSYCICLTVTDPSGNTDTECKTDMIIVYQSPVSDFSASTTAACGPITIDFTDISIPGSGTITSWTWDLNNGSCQGTTTQNPSCNYTTPGTYDISLIVEDDNGCTHFIEKQDFITIFAKPDSDFTVNVLSTSCQPPISAEFIPTTPDDPDYSYEWFFGDGTSSTSYNPTHAYTSTGQFSVTFIIHHTVGGCSDTTTYNNIVDIGNLIDFTYTPGNGCQSLSVDFTDASQGSASGWTWDFGDGNSSTQQNPTHTYTVPGCYTVTLNATSNGCPGTQTTQNCIEVFELPVASFTSNAIATCNIPYTVTFNGMSSIANSTFDWDFGDGNSSTLQAPSNTYNSHGSYPVSLTVTTPNGCSDVVIADTIEIEEFNMNIAADSVQGCAPMTVTFNANSNINYPITTINWDFGNATTGNGNPVTTVYSDTGQYQVIAIATNSIGCTDTSVFSVQVGQQMSINFMADDTVACANHTFQFTDLTLGDIDGWFWDFGDGATSTDQNPNHMYSDTGSYTVCLTVIQNGCETTYCIVDYINILPPIARFEIARNCSTPYTIVFNDQSIGADSWYWDFGVPLTMADTSTLQFPVFTFPDRGTYTVTLTVLNDSTGCYHTFIEDVEIQDPDANFSITPLTGCAPLTVMVSDSSLDADTYHWYATGANITPSATSPNPDLIYSNAGVYTGIGLAIEDEFGCVDSLTLNDTITVSDVFPGFTVDTLEGCRPLTVNFTDISQTFAWGIVSWDWDFDDGTTSTLQHPTKIFTNSGSYDVSLTVTNGLGCSKTFTLPNSIDVLYPEVSFSAVYNLCTEQTVTFNNTSNTASPSTYYWDFGDGNTSTDEEPTHFYTNEGVYTICLTVTDYLGCDSTYCRTDYITVGNPVAEFTADSLYAPCPPLPVNFSDQSLNAVDWFWDFGDNSALVNAQNPTHIYSDPGSYDVCLYIRSISGCWDTICKPDYIVIDGPVGSFTFTPTSGCAPLEVNLTAIAMDAAIYTWDNGCGDVQVHVSSDTIDTATFIYQQAGICTPILVLEDAQGCQRTIVASDPVIIDELDVSISTTAQSFCGSGSVLFESSIYSSLPVNSYEWHFPGGTPATSSNANETVTYSSTGNYPVTLIVDNGVCLDTFIQPNYVTIYDAPQADYLISMPSSNCEPALVNFTDVSTIASGSIVSWFWDFGTGDTSIVQHPSYVYQNAGNYTVTLIVMSNDSCTATHSQNFVIEPLPQVNAGLDEAICWGESIQLQSIGNGSHQWSPSTGLSCTSCSDPIANPTATTQYVVQLTGSNGCVAYDTMTVAVSPYPVPQLNLYGDTTSCPGGLVQLTATSNQSNVSFNWDTTRPGLSCYTNCFNPFAQPTQTTTYVVTVTNQGGCSRVDSITIQVLTNPVDVAGPDRTICEGESVQLNATTGLNHKWTPSIGLSCTYCPNPIVSPPETMFYYLEVETFDGCVITDSILVNVFGQADLYVGADRTICLGESTILDAIGVGNVTWTPGSTLDDPTIIMPEATPTTSTTYTISLQNDLCILTDSIVVTVKEKAEVLVDPQTICIGDTTSLEATGDATSYYWTTASGTQIGNNSVLEVNPESTTTYTVIGELGNCESDTVNVTVTVNPMPTIELLPYHSVLLGESINIESSVSGTSNPIYDWQPEEIFSCMNCPRPEASPDTTTQVQVFVTDENGCVGRVLPIWLSSLNAVLILLCFQTPLHPIMMGSMICFMYEVVQLIW